MEFTPKKLIERGPVFRQKHLATKHKTYFGSLLIGVKTRQLKKPCRRAQDAIEYAEVIASRLNEPIIRADHQRYREMLRDG